MKKRAWIAIPLSLLPYLVLLALATIFLSTKNSFFEWVMGSAFGDNALYLIATFLIYCVVVAVLSVVHFIFSIYKKCDALLLAKLFMIIKLLQIPAYVIIFVLGVLWMITFFTIPFSIALIFFAYFSLFLSGLGVIAAVINAIRQGIFKPSAIFWVPIAQFVFCLDVVASIVLYVKLKKFKKKTQIQSPN